MPRTYFRCPRCPWLFVWAYLPATGKDPDVGLDVIAAHMEAAHPETVYGPLVPAGVLRKVLRLRE